MRRRWRNAGGLAAAVAAPVGVVCAVTLGAQPACLEQRITPATTFSFGYFSESVAISGDRVIVGQPTLAATGSAFIFEYTPQIGWIQVQQAVAPDGVLGDLWCLNGIAIEGDVAAIGSRLHEHEGHPGTGAVWMLRRIDNSPGAGGWIFEQEILGPDGVINFGRRVIIEGEHMVITMTGGAQFFQFDGISWKLRQTLPQPRLYPGDISFAATMSMDSNVLVLGASGDDSMCGIFPEKADSGLVFVYRFNGIEWAEDQILAPSNPGCVRRFGASVAVSGDTIIATAQNPVATYVFEYDRESGRWIETAILSGVGPETGVRPLSAAIEGDWAVIGDDSDDEAHVFHRQPDGSWVLVDLLQPPDALWFGQAVAIDQGRAIIGAFGEDGGHGAAYIYRLDAPAADLNCDGVVNGIDLGNLLANWSIPPDMPGCFGDSPCSADLNSDGLVNGLDLGILLANWTL